MSDPSGLCNTFRNWRSVHVHRQEQRDVDCSIVFSLQQASLPSVTQLDQGLTAVQDAKRMGVACCMLTAYEVM